MQQLLLVGNPAKHRRRKSSKTPSPAQKRARAAFAAMARARSGKSRSNPARKRRARVASRTRQAKSSIVIRSNPVKHRRHRRAAPAHRRHHRRVHRNPISVGSMRGITGQLKSAAFLAVGALGVDVAYGFVGSYLPASMQSPADATTGGINYAYYAAKGAAAVGIGMLLRRAIGAARAARVVEGSLTVTMHDAMKQFVGANVKSVPLGMYPRVSAQRLNGLNPAKVVQLPVPGQRVGMGMYLNAASRESAIR